MRLLAATLFSALLSAPAFAADLGTYRPGTPYSSVVAAGADVCDSQCAGDAQCRGWNYVKPNPRAKGVCEFLSSVSSPISSSISISGESLSATPFSSRVTTGATNTVRVGTSVSPRTNTVKVGQTPSGRRVVRQAPTKRATPTTVSARPAQGMSLTEQQNRYRQNQIQRPAQDGTRRPVQSQPIPQQPARPMFRPMLDAPAPSQQRRQAYAPQQPAMRPMQQNPMNMGQPLGRMNPRMPTSSRRMTGPRNGVAPARTAPQPYASRPQSNRPPIGQPIATPQNQGRPAVSSPSQRLAQLTAQTGAPTEARPAPAQGAVALNPNQAQQSLFGRLNDDVSAPGVMPRVSAVPTAPVAQEPLGPTFAEQLAGGR